MRGLAVALVLAGPISAEELSVDPGLVLACLERATPRTCIGDAAAACMASDPTGQTTPGDVLCRGQEADVWDGILNDVYNRSLAAADMEPFLDGPSEAELLRDMQRAWIAYRDARCGLVAVDWGPGTGRQPAVAACHLRVTAEQAILLARGDRE